jgi:hypothetical protein
MHRSSNRLSPSFGALLTTLVVFLLFGWAAGVACAANPVVLTIDGTEFTLEDLAADYDLRNSPETFRAADLETKRQSLQTMGDDLTFVRIAREAVGGLDPASTMKLEQSRNGGLLQALDDHVAAAIDADTLAALRIVRDRLNREVDLLQFVGASDSVATAARDQVVRGKSFEEVVRALESDPARREKGPELGWMSAAQFGDELMEDLFLKDRQPGYITEVHGSRNGFEFLKIKEFRPLDPRSQSKAEPQLAAAVARMRRRQTLAAYRDSLTQAHRLEVDSAAASALQRVMAAFWDSVFTGDGQTGMRPNPTRPPLWRLDAATGARRLLQVDGKGVTLESFMRGLETIPPGVWPNAPKLDVFQRQVRFRILIDLRIAEARRLGLDRSPAYGAASRLYEEQILREALQRRLAPRILVSKQEIQSYYDENKEGRFRQYDRISLSYLIFPKESEASAWLSQARSQNYIWWKSEIKRLQAERPEVRSVPNTPEIDLAQPVSDEVRPIIDQARELKPGDILQSPVRAAGGWAAVRVLDRQRAGYLPIEKAESGIRSAITLSKMDKRIQALVEQGKASHQLKLYPDRL